MTELSKDDIRESVRETYKLIAVAEGPSCCGPSGSTCCGPEIVQLDSTQLGYSAADLAAVPEGADLGLGCGNPGAIAALKAGETVLDLGAGAGFDAFLAARAVGESGLVIGVDMTSEMVARARTNATTGGYSNVEFRLGEIEHLPVADNSVDCIISNCVINLSPDKQLVFNEAFRVLKPGGRVAISDVVAFAPIPAEVLSDMALYSGCVAGASQVEEVEQMLAAAGFTDIKVDPKDESKQFIRDWAPDTPITEYVVSANIEAIKP